MSQLLRKGSNNTKRETGKTGGIKMSEAIQLKPEQYSEARIEAMKEAGTWVEPKPELKQVETKVEVKKEIKPTKEKKIKEVKTKELQLTIKDSLVNDIVKIYNKYLERARVQTIMFYWELGKKLNKEWGKPRGHGENMSGHHDAHCQKTTDSRKQLCKLLKQNGINICERNISYARKFAQEQPHIKQYIDDPKVTWTQIIKNILPENKKEPPKQIEFNNAVSKYFSKWNSFVNDFSKGISQVNFAKAPKQEKEECIKLLEKGIKKLQKRLEVLKNE